MNKDFVIRRVRVEEILDLRHRMLRSNLPFEAARFEGDGDSRTVHFAGFFEGKGDGVIVGAIACASVMSGVWQGGLAWQLRGMAVDSGYQGHKLGRRLLAFIERDMSETSDIGLFWCNARQSAVAFYEKQGWAIASDLFDIPFAGPHCKMFKEFRARLSKGT
ncbi:MAG: GNAT family N-acetyltransferase [Candidatus Paceibacterota bacterium]|jgi:GNAT superfamily N-acetyltransferase